MGSEVVSPIPAAELFGLCPEIVQLLQEVSCGTGVEDVLPGRTFVQGGIIDVSQEPVRSQLDVPIPSCRKSLFPAREKAEMSLNPGQIEERINLVDTHALCLGKPICRRIWRGERCCLEIFVGVGFFRGGRVAIVTLQRLSRDLE